MYYHPILNLKPEEIIAYLRKSQSDDPLLTVEEVLQKHESILDEWSEKHLGGKVPDENKFREVVSGETLKDRPEIQKVLSLIESPRYKAVEVVEPQRLTRGDLEDIGRLMKLLKHTNTLVITPERTYDLRDEYDWNALESELKKGNDYLNYYKKIQNRGRLLSVSQGNYIGSIAPYGYRKTVVKEGKRDCPTLEIYEKEAEVVRMIFHMYVNENMGRTSICRKLDSMKIKPPKGDFWSPAAMKDMIENIHYIGKVKWNWRKTLIVVEDSEFIKTRPKAKVGEFLVFDGRHPAIISEELFNAAQQKKGKSTRTKFLHELKNPFAGILYCRCGRAMSHKNDAKAKYPLFLCNNQANCRTRSCSYHDIVDRVADVLKQCIEDFEVRISNDDVDSIKMHERLIKQLETKLEELNKKEVSQWDKYTEEGMPKHIFDKLNEKVLREKEEVQQALCKAYESMPDPVDYEEKMHTFQKALDALLDPDVSVEDKNNLLRKCIDRIEYHREKGEKMKRTTPRKRITVDGKRKVVSNLSTGANWTDTPISLDVKLKV